MISPLALSVSGPIRVVAAAALANGGSATINAIAANSLVIRDTPTLFQFWVQFAGFTNYMPQLLSLANAGKIASIDVRNGGVPVFPITAADFTTYAPVFALINTPYLAAQIITVHTSNQWNPH